MDRIENASPKSSSIVASRSYRHGACREQRFPVTSLLHVMNLLPSSEHVFMAIRYQWLSLLASQFLP
jgi:hypothetical protein